MTGWFQVDLEHLAEQYSVRVLNLRHPLYKYERNKVSEASLTYPDFKALSCSSTSYGLASLVQLSEWLA